MEIVSSVFRQLSTLKKHALFSKTQYGVAVLSGFVLGMPAQSLTINLIDIGASPMTAAQMTAFESAAQIWENRFSDPITVTLNVAWDDASEFSSASVLAATTTARTSIASSTVRACMLADASGTTEYNAVQLLPASVPVTDTNGGRNDNMVTMATANAKALGVSPSLDPLYGDALANNADGQIRYNNAFLSDFDIDRSDGIGASDYDFIGVAAHEIGHALGFFSLTDVQDGNPGFTLHPNTLDLWRFAETGNFHNVNTETRQVTAADAEFYDTVLNNIPFSRGTAVTDPLCQGSGGTCQASHWQDDQGNMMDPTVDTGVQVDPTSDDTHALNYIGYDPKYWFIFPRFVWYDVRLRFFEPVCLSCPPWLYKRFFEDFAPPPEFRDIKAPFEGVNAAFYIGLGGEQEGFEARSGLGFARFERAQENKNPNVFKSTDVGEKQWEVEEFADSPMKIIPPRLMNFYFESDQKAGVAFRFSGAFASGGASFDETLGEFGGFRVSGVMDTDEDRDRGDIDATTTMLLLLQEPADVNKGIMDLPFAIKWQDGTEMEDNGVTIVDYAAFRLREPDNDRDKVPNSKDNCPEVYNPNQVDSNRNGIGDKCEAEKGREKKMVVKKNRPTQPLIPRKSTLG